MSKTEKKRGRPRKSEDDKAKKNEYIECDICGNGIKFQRSNRSKHYKTRIHQANLKMIKMIKDARMKEINKKSMSISELRVSRYGKKISDPNDEIDESEFITDIGEV
jgi:hypothetical protein